MNAREKRNAREQLAMDILTTAVESGYEWFLYHEIDRDEDLNVIRVVVEVREGVEECTCAWNPFTGTRLATNWTCLEHGSVRADAVTMEITPVGIERTLARYRDDEHRGTWLNTFAWNFLDGSDLCDFDVIDADAILQCATMGQIVFG